MAIRERIAYKECPLCGCVEFSLGRKVDLALGPLVGLTIERKLQWRKCDACGHDYTEGYWPDELMRQMLEILPQHTMTLNVERSCWRRIVEFVIENLDWGAVAGDARWLDIGFGHGCGISVAEEYGFEASGIDIQKANVERMQAWGYNVQKAFFEEFVESAKHNEETWDVIVLAEFLEHCPFPVDALKKVKALLRPGGVVYVSVPSRDCIVWRVKDAMVDGGPKINIERGMHPLTNWSQLEHYHVFTRKMLEDTFRKAGLDPVAFRVGERWFETMEVIGR